jgi:hypothetical protein
MMLHLMKLAVGAPDVSHLRAFQADRMASNPPLRHQTRNFPRRAAEILDGGSMFWVIAGAIVVRQRILDITEGRWDDGRVCAALILDSELVSVAGRPTKPFQGWRYLPPGEAPADLVADAEIRGGDRLPDTLQRELRALCLI